MVFSVTGLALLHVAENRQPLLEGAQGHTGSDDSGDSRASRRSAGVARLSRDVALTQPSEAQYAARKDSAPRKPSAPLGSTTAPDPHAHVAPISQPALEPKPVSIPVIPRKPRPLVDPAVLQAIVDFADE